MATSAQAHGAYAAMRPRSVSRRRVSISAVSEIDNDESGSGNVGVMTSKVAVDSYSWKETAGRYEDRHRRLGNTGLLAWGGAFSHKALPSRLHGSVTA